MDEKEYKISRRQQNFDLIKFILGTVILGLIAHCINLHIQKSKLELDAQEFEKEYLKVYIDNYVGADNKTKADFLNFMRFLSFSDNRKESYDSLFKYVQAEIDSNLLLKKELNLSIDKSDSLFMAFEDTEKKRIQLSSKLKNTNKSNAKLIKSLGDSLARTIMIKNDLEHAISKTEDRMEELIEEAGAENLSVKSEITIKVSTRSQNRSIPIRNAEVIVTAIRYPSFAEVVSTNEDGIAIVNIKNGPHKGEKIKIQISKNGYKQINKEIKYSRFYSTFDLELIKL